MAQSTNLSILDDWFSDTIDGGIDNISPLPGSNICTSKEGSLKKENYLGEFLTEADKRKARENLGITNVETSADKVIYETPEDTSIKNVKDALDKILYTPLDTTLLQTNPSEAEIGSTVLSVTYTWNYNKNIVSQTFNGSVLSSDVRTQTIVESLTSTTTKTLVANDGSKNKSFTFATTFKEGRYFGVGANTIVLNDILNSFTLNLNLNKGNSFTVTANEGEYIYLLLPNSIGDVSFFVGGFEGGFFVVDNNFQFTKYVGHTIPCTLYRSDNSGLGTTTVTIR